MTKKPPSPWDDPEAADIGRIPEAIARTIGDTDELLVTPPIAEDPNRTPEQIVLTPEEMERIKGAQKQALKQSVAEVKAAAPSLSERVIEEIRARSATRDWTPPR